MSLDVTGTHTTLSNANADEAFPTHPNTTEDSPDNPLVFLYGGVPRPWPRNPQFSGV